MKPPSLQGCKLVPDVDVLIERLRAVETQITQLEAKLKTPLTAQEQAGVFAHRASLLRRKQWYLSRIRTVRPIETIGALVADEIHTAEAGP